MRVLVLKIAFLETRAEEHLAVTPGCRPRITAVYFLPDQQTRTQTAAAIGNDPPLYAHMPLYPFFEVIPPGAAPGPPVKTGARVRRFRGCNKSYYRTRRDLE